MLLGDLILTDIKLRAVVNSEEDCILPKPRIKSKVLITDISSGQKRELAVVAYSEVDKYLIKIGDITFQVKDKLFLNGDAYKGLVKIDPLLDWMEKVTADMEALKEALASHPVSGDGAALGIIWETSANVPSLGEITNNKVQHG
mgnify:CR=1 FL=1